MTMNKARATLSRHPQLSLQSPAPPVKVCPPVLLALVVPLDVDSPPLATVGFIAITVATELLKDTRAELIITAEAAADEVIMVPLVKPDVSMLMTISMVEMVVGTSSTASPVVVDAE